MSTKTQTTTTHYHIQKKRRAEFIDEWRKYRQSVIRKEDVKLERTARGLRTGVYMGWDGDRPTRQLDALVHEIDPGTTTTIHRHSWDAILFMVEGSGWTDAAVSQPLLDFFRCAQPGDVRSPGDERYAIGVGAIRPRRGRGAIVVLTKH